MFPTKGTALNVIVKQKKEPEGILVINKPSGMTSHDVVNRIRRKFKMRRVGHAGTLDPLATGVLIMILGKATKLFGKFESFDKAYRATLLLGTKTTTADIQGEVITKMPAEHVTQSMIQDILKKFVGEIDQTPPMVSAVKFKGQRLYELARKGIEVERPSRRVRISRLDLVAYEPPYVKIYLECSKGTYVRTIAEDVGQILGCGACITEIERTKVGPFDIANALGLDVAEEQHVQPWSVKM